MPEDPTTIEIMPRTWVSVMPMLLEVLECGTPEGKIEVRKELMRLAESADTLAELAKRFDEA